MARSRRIPAYVHHKPTGQARVRIDGKDHYLGKYGSPASHDRYDDLIAKFVTGTDSVSTKTLTAVLAVWWPECKRRYWKGKGKLGGAQNWRGLIRLLRTHHGEKRAEDLGPVKLRTLLEQAAKENDWSLKFTKKQLSRTKQIFKWAVGEELVSVTAYQRLAVVEIRHGRHSTPLPPVDDELVERTLPLLKPNIADMVRVQRLTGMRPGELVAMRANEIDRPENVWTYVPGHHKTEHHGKTRIIYIGPKAQSILAPWLVKATDCVFPTRLGKGYSTDSYRRAIQRACERNELPRWSPQQLRKAAATEIRSKLDVEFAASILGHSSSIVTGDHYASADRQRAIEAAKLLG